MLDINGHSFGGEAKDYVIKADGADCVIKDLKDTYIKCEV
jgi:hypothetical protein